MGQIAENERRNRQAQQEEDDARRPFQDYFNEMAHRRQLQQTSQQQQALFDELVEKANSPRPTASAAAGTALQPFKQHWAKWTKKTTNNATDTGGDGAPKDPKNPKKGNGKRGGHPKKFV